MAESTPRPERTRADHLLPGDQWLEHGTLMTMIERCPAPLSNQVRLRFAAGMASNNCSTCSPPTSAYCCRRPEGEGSSDDEAGTGRHHPAAGAAVGRLGN